MTASVLLAAAVLAQGSIAGAELKPQAPAAVGVVFPACPREPFSFEAAMAAVRIELGHEGVRRVARLAAPGAATEAWIEISFDCSDEPTALRVRIHDPRTRDVSRTMELYDLPTQLRPRGLALVVAELARAAWVRSPSGQPAGEQAAPFAQTDNPQTAPEAPAEPPPTSSAPSAPEALPAVDAASAAPTTAFRRLALTVAGGLRGFSPDATLLLGVRIGGTSGRLRFGFDSFGGLRDDPLGSVTLMTESVWLAVDAITLQRQSWRLRTGPRVSAGVTYGTALNKSDSRRSSAYEPYLDAAIEAGTDFRLGQSYWGSIDFEAGVARGMAVYADDRRTASVGGFLVGGRVGVVVWP